MDRPADFEIPSPKRIRLQAPEPEPAIDPATPVGDIDDLYGRPLVQPHSPTRSSHVIAPALSSSAFPIDRKLLQLPGLGMLDGDPAFSNRTPYQQSQASSFPETEQGSSTIGARDMELENGQKPQVNGEQDSIVDDERIVDIQTSAPEHTSSISDEVFVDGDDIAVTKSETRVSEAEAPVRQDLTCSPSELAQTTLDWHSSGTLNDTEIWLGGYSIEKAPSTASDSRTARAGTNAEVWQDKDVDRFGDWHSSGTFIDNRMWLGGYSIEKAQSRPLESNTARAGTNAEVLQDIDLDQAVDIFEKHLLSGAGLVAGRSEKTVSEKPALEDLAEANKDTEEAEFELDSSPLGSDTSSEDSTDTSSSDDSDADDYEMLSPAEQARRLMAEDGGSDGEGKGRKVTAEVPRTLNEKPDEFVPKPSVAVTEDMKIEELGLVDNIVENLALVKANTSGEYQVLESGSLLCLPDRSVIGVVSETLGRVQQPYYSVRFTNATAIAEAGIEKGKKIFYVTQHSTTVFTQTLKAIKGSDASNLHDEEVGDDELEFSDDEAEAEHKRQIKQQRMAKHRARDGQPDGYSRGPQQRPGGPGPRLNGGSRPIQERPPNSAEAVLNYDDADGMNVRNNEDEEGPYTPLARPSNLHEILSGKATPISSHGPRGNSNRGRGDSRGGNRGRGDNRGGGCNRGMRGSERGGRQNRKNHGNRGEKGQTYRHPIPPTPQTNDFGTSQTNGLPPRPSPETMGYQRSTPQGSSFPHPLPQQPPTPSPAYQTPQQKPQFPTHSGYPSQYPNAYNQSYPQQPPHQPYPPYVPQQHHSPYHQQPQQSFPQQGYQPQFASQPDVSFTPPGPQYPASLPPGAHINPNFFKQQAQASQAQGWQQGYNQQQQQQQHLAYPASGSIGPPATVANETRLQELLRGFGNGGGSS